MLHPKQFEVNEAWLAFKLNVAPLHTEEDGEHHCVALMDAASCFILSNAFFSAGEDEPAESAARRFLEEAKEHKRVWPKTLFIPRGQFNSILPAEAERHGITVVRVPEDQLLVFVGGARELFRKHFGQGATQ